MRCSICQKTDITELYDTGICKDCTNAATQCDIVNKFAIVKSNKDLRSKARQAKMPKFERRSSSRILITPEASRYSSNRGSAAFKQRISTVGNRLSVSGPRSHAGSLRLSDEINPVIFESYILV